MQDNEDDDSDGAESDYWSSVKELQYGISHC